MVPSVLASNKGKDYQKLKFWVLTVTALQQEIAMSAVLDYLQNTGLYLRFRERYAIIVHI